MYLVHCSCVDTPLNQHVPPHMRFAHFLRDDDNVIKRSWKPTPQTTLDGTGDAGSAEVAHYVLMATVCCSRWSSVDARLRRLK